MSQSATQVTAVALHSQGGTVSVRTHRRTAVRMMTGRFGTVKVYAPSKEGVPDAFLLTGVGADGEEVYRCLKTMEDAVGLPDPVTGEEAESAADPTWYVVFHRADNEHAPGPGALYHGGTTFQLDHLPAGTERGARTVRSGMLASGVFANGPYSWSQIGDGSGVTVTANGPTTASRGTTAAPATTRSPAPAGGGPQETADEREGRIARETKSMAMFVATRFYHSDELAYPAGSACVLHRPDRLRYTHDDLNVLTTKADHPVVARRRVWALGQEDAVFDPVEREAAMEDLGVPEGEEVEGEVGQPEHEAEWRASPLDDPLADRPLWLSLLTDASLLWGASGAPEAPAGADDEPDPGPPAPRLLGVWKVDPADGTYQYASYPDSADDSAPEAADDAPPEVHGAATSFVLVPIIAVSKSHNHSAWALATYGPLPQACLERAAVDLADDPLSTVQFEVDGGSASTYGHNVLNTAESNARWDGEAKCWKVYLPDVARVTARLSRVARRAAERHQEWNETRPDARLNARLVAAACYRPEHGRTYLDEVLYKRRRGDTDMKEAWEGFDPPDVKWAGLGDLGEGSSELWNAAYGLQRQEAYLGHRRRVAAACLEAWLALPVVGVYLRSGAAARASGEEAWPEAAGAVVAEGLGAMCGGGAGGRLMHRLLSEAEVVQRTVAAAPTAMDRVLDGLEEAREWPWDQIMGAPTFTALWAITEKGGEGALAVFESFGPAVTSTYSWTRNWKKQAALAVVAEWKLSDRSSDGTMELREGRVYVEHRVNGVLETTVTIEGAATVKNLQHQRRAPRCRIDYKATGTTSVRWPGTRRNAGVVLSAMDVGINLAGMATSVRSGTLGLADAAALGDTLVGLAGIYEATAAARGATTATQALRAARILGRAAPLVEGAAAFAGIASGIGAVTPSGAQRVQEADKGQVLASVVSGVGTVILTGAFGTVTLGVGAVGVGLVATGAAIGWADAFFDAKRQKEEDPLYKWLPRGSLWGNLAGSVVKTHALMELGRPGWTGGGGTSLSSDAVNEQTRAFIEKAFVFPVGARGRLLHGDPEPNVSPAFRTPLPLLDSLSIERPLPVTKGLVFTIDPWFVPAFGTLALEAGVRRISETGAPIGEPVPVRCVVHYVRGSGGFYYRVMPAWDQLALGSEAQDLLQYAIKEGWAWSDVEKVNLPDGTMARHAVLKVHVGTGWTIRKYTESERRERGEAQRVAEQGRASSPLGWVSPTAQGRTRADVADAATDASEGVEALSVLPPPPGLAAALGGPSLAARSASVSGSAAFSPVVPFDPAPTPARYAPGALAARQRVGGVPGSVTVQFEPGR